MLRSTYGTVLLPTGAAAARAATREERAQTMELVRRDLDEGGFGIGLRTQYRIHDTPLS